MATLQFSGERLREACATRGVTAQVLAQRTGRSISSIYKWRTERARPGANELAAIAEALGAPFDAFYAPMPAPVEAVNDRG